MKFVLKLFFAILFLTPNPTFASAFLPANTPQSKLVDPQETNATAPRDALLTLFKERVTSTLHDITKTNGEIQRSSNDQKLYYQRALLSFKLRLLSDAIGDCVSIKFDNNKPQSFFHAHYLRNAGVLRPVYDEAIDHPSCNTVESSESLRQSYEDLRRSADVLAYPRQPEYAFDPSQDLLKAIQLDGNYKEAYLLRADLLSYDRSFESKRERELDFFNELIKRFPDDAFSYIQRTEYQNEGQQSLIESCKKSQDIDPNLFESYVCLYHAWEHEYAGDFCENNSYCIPRLLPQEEKIYEHISQDPAYGDDIYHSKFEQEQIEKVQSLNPKYPGINDLVKAARQGYLDALLSFEEGKCEYLQFYNEKQNCDKVRHDCKEEFKICEQETKQCYKESKVNFERCKQGARARINSGKFPAQSFNSAQVLLPEIKKQIQKDIDTVKDLKRVVEKAAQETQKIEYDQFEDIVENVVVLSKRNGITKEELLFPPGLLVGGMAPSGGDNVAQLKVNIGDLLVSTAKLGVGSIPVIGNVVSMYEFLSGKDLFTGEKLGGLERTISCLGIFVGSGKAWMTVASGIEKGLGGQLASNIIQDMPERRSSLDKAVTVFKNSLSQKAKTAVSEAGTKAALHDPPSVGQKVYRIFGQDVNKNIDEKGAGPFGGSWTPVDPNTMPDSRSVLGLPNENQGRFVIEGRLKSIEGIVVKPAKELDGNPGGGTEYLVPNSGNQIEIERVSGVNKEF